MNLLNQITTTNDKYTILVVDDILDNLRLLNKVFVTKGFEVSCAISGQIALQSIRSGKKPDLILLDIKMPGMNGFETCQQLKNDPSISDIPIIFCSSLRDTENKLKGFDAGAVDYISKPFDISEVLARVQIHLKIFKLQKELKRANQARDEAEQILRHDLKAPLNAVLNFPGLIKKRGSLDDKQSLFLDRIQEAGHRLLNLINQSNDLYKIENGLYHLHLISFDILPVLQNIIDYSKSLIENRHLSIRITLNGKTPQKRDTCNILGDELLSYSLFSNLIKNALEASKKEEKIQVIIKQGKTTSIMIKNETLVPEPMQSCFFEKYKTFGKSNGTGLGTYSARLSAKIQNATIEMQSKQKSGTCVTVRFPEIEPK
jgi:two-component system, sensor histidine kinase and response regulator